MSCFDLFYYVLGGLSVLAACYSFFAANASESHKKLILIFWLVAPPVFFFVEYSLRQPTAGPDIERIKDMQERAAAIWAGVSAALAALYIKQ